MKAFGAIVKAFTLSYHNQEIILFTIDPDYGKCLLAMALPPSSGELSGLKGFRSLGSLGFKVYLNPPKHIFSRVMIESRLGFIIRTYTR